MDAIDIAAADAAKMAAVHVAAAASNECAKAALATLEHGYDDSDSGREARAGARSACRDAADELALAASRLDDARLRQVEAVRERDLAHLEDLSGRATETAYRAAIEGDLAEYLRLAGRQRALMISMGATSARHNVVVDRAEQLAAALGVVAPVMVRRSLGDVRQLCARASFEMMSAGGETLDPLTLPPAPMRPENTELYPSLAESEEFRAFLDRVAS